MLGGVLVYSLILVDITIFVGVCVGCTGFSPNYDIGSIVDSCKQDYFHEYLSFFLRLCVCFLVYFFLLLLLLLFLLFISLLLLLYSFKIILF